MAVAECTRNVACSGAEPIGLTDCLNFGNPERPEVMQQLSDAVDGIAEACTALKVPVVSGNVSLYNETIDANGKPRGVLPTPTVAVVGQLRRLEDAVVSHLDHAGGDSALLMIGPRGEGALGGSEYVARRSREVVGAPPVLDLDAETKVQRLVVVLARAGRLHAAHDISSGGLATALSEMAVGGREDVGVNVALPWTLDGFERIRALFSETPSRIIIAVAPNHVADVEARAHSAGVECVALGTTTTASNTAGSVRISSGGAPLIEVECATLRTAREACLTAIVGE
jgi:phosphoribosylformylglycinamidine (FGAM) synthase-like enzyme